MNVSGGYSVETWSTGTETRTWFAALFICIRSFFKAAAEIFFCHAPFDQPAPSQVMHTEIRATVNVF